MHRFSATAKTALLILSIFGGLERWLKIAPFLIFCQNERIHDIYSDASAPVSWIAGKNKLAALMFPNQRSYCIGTSLRVCDELHRDRERNRK